jgi:hypothetical protein
MGLRSIHDIAEYSELAVPGQCDLFQERYIDWMLFLSAFGMFLEHGGAVMGNVFDDMLKISRCRI